MRRPGPAVYDWLCGCSRLNGRPTGNIAGNCRMIPDWNSQGVLPPARPGAGDDSADRAPYRVSLQQLVERFAISPARAALLRSFLDYRSALHSAGIITGFQWVDGSFVENIEALKGREPNDIDIVTFCAMPEERYGDLFDNRLMKNTFHIDAYFCSIDLPLIPDRVKLIDYWYSVFAHRRDGSWKGFVEVDLIPFEDPAARTALNEQMRRKVGCYEPRRVPFRLV